jgi:aspartyl-tRNA(Asn)/glutamyl-tRNA(Gln) amidotransferase subunit B
VKRAIEVEAKRLTDILENGDIITQQTRSFDAGSNKTFSIRDKEDAEDYRYFPEPDLTPFYFQDDFIDTIRRSIPALQEERIKKYIFELQLSEYDAAVLTEEKTFSDYFEKVIQHTDNYKAIANWMLGPVKSWMNENNKEISEFPVMPPQLAALIDLIDSGRVSFSVASTKIFAQLVNDPSKDPGQIIIDQNLIQQSDVSVLEPVIDQVLIKYADKVMEYKKGKKGLLALFVGEVMKQSKGKADPKITNELLVEKLKS